MTRDRAHWYDFRSMVHRPRLAPTLAVLALLASGCSDLGSPLRLEPRPQLSATSLDFGTVAVSASSQRSVTIGNLGDADLVGDAAVSCPEFRLDAGGGAFRVPPGGEHVVEVSFVPGAVGSASCALTLGAGLPSVELNGQAALQAPGAQCVALPSSLDFGVQAVGGSRLGVFKVFNLGTDAALLDVASGCGAFAVVSGGGPSTLPPGDSLAVTVAFAPSVGGSIECQIEVGPGCTPVPVRGDATTVSFSADIAPILSQQQCTLCHGWTAARQIVNVTSAGYRPARIIVPFDTTGSVLYGKITNSGRYGASMPQGGPLMPLGQRVRIRDWILEGARDN